MGWPSSARRTAHFGPPDLSPPDFEIIHVLIVAEATTKDSFDLSHTGTGDKHSRLGFLEYFSNSDKINADSLFRVFECAFNQTLKAGQHRRMPLIHNLGSEFDGEEAKFWPRSVFHIGLDLY